METGTVSNFENSSEFWYYLSLNFYPEVRRHYLTVQDFQEVPSGT